MDCAWDDRGEYRKTLKYFLTHGGSHNQAAKKATEIESKLRLGLDCRSQTTDHGETRIKNCVKYDLGNGFRLVTVQQADVIVFIYIGDHDGTDEWLTRHKGLVPVFNKKTWKTEFTIPSAPKPWQIAPQSTVSITNIPFLTQVVDIDWKVTIKSAAIRLFLQRFDQEGDNQELLDILEELKKDQPREAELCLVVINFIRSGQGESAQAAIDLYLGKVVIATEDTPLTGNMLRAEANQGRFVVLNDLSEEEITRLHDPLRFREWMIFLHPGQRRIVEEDYSGPALLAGVSGSGKTSVLVHRARRLAELHPKERILILTLNNSLARLIEILANDLCLKGEMDRIEVKSFHSFLSDVLNSLDCAAFLRRMAEFTGMQVDVDSLLLNTRSDLLPQLFKPITEREQLRQFGDFLAEPGNPAKIEFDRLEVYVYSQDQTIDLRRYLFEELELVRSAFTCYDGYKGYYEYVAEDSLEFNYQRTGRSIVFAEKRRNAVIMILREWERFQLRNRFVDLMGLTQAALFAVDEQGAFPERFRYRSVLVDEFQDFSTLELSLLRLIPQFAENGLFMTGDFAQKVYAKDLNLPSAGLGRVERTDRIIRRNYRNSRQILLAAYALLEAYPPQFAGSEEDVAVLKPEYASKESALPIATEASDPILAAWNFAEEWLRGGHVPFSVCIATANGSAIPVESILAAKPATVEADILTGDYLLKSNRVVVADISSVKGFEFSLIIICGLNNGVFPPLGGPVAEHWRDALRLYVAITRGREEVRFIYQDIPSPFLMAMGTRIQYQKWDAPVRINVLTETVQEPSRKALGDEIRVTVESEQVQVLSPTSRFDSVTQFLETHKPEVLNGITILSVPSGATQFELSRALGKCITEVSLACQSFGDFTPPDYPRRDHIIRGVCNYFRCAPNIIALR